MATITNPDIIEELLSEPNPGAYPGDPYMERVYSYNTQHGVPVFAIFEDIRYDDMHSSPFVYQPVLLFDKHYGLTQAGRDFLEKDSS